jgi:hypothetical protein
MKIGDPIYVYQDGKLGRGALATVVALRAQGIKASFIIDDEDITIWFRRRRRQRGGIYEGIGWNYWIMCNRQQREIAKNMLNSLLHVASQT